MGKFTEDDREEVIRFLEKENGIKLAPIGRKRKFLRDGSGRLYCVLGGYEEWHAIDFEFLTEEYSRDGVLVFCERNKDFITVYKGYLKPLYENRGKLSSAKGSFHLHLEKKSGVYYVKEAPEVSLEEIDKVRVLVDAGNGIRSLMKKLKSDPQLMKKIESLMRS